MQSSDRLYAYGNIKLAVSDGVLNAFPHIDTCADLSRLGVQELANDASKTDIRLSFQPAQDSKAFNETRGFKETRAFNEAKALCLDWYKDGEKKPLSFSIDYTAVIKNLRSFPAPKQGAFNQALGNKSKSILDATGGWGSDAMLMATQGYAVKVLERNPIMALLLQDGFRRLTEFRDSLGLHFIVPQIECVDSIEAISKFSSEFDCAYLDPMFPPKRKKSAATNKQMQLLQWMIGEDLDASELLEQALNAGFRRVAVKRPDYAEPLFRKPSQQFSSKLVHYDVYLQS